MAQGIIICDWSFGEETDGVRGKAMVICPKCQEDVPEGMQFCLQCGASLAPTPPIEADFPEPADPELPPEPPIAPAPPVPVTVRPQARRPSPTISLKTAPTPMMTPPPGADTGHARPRFRERMVEIDDEESFEGPVVQPGAVLCRFCRGPLDLAGEYCEQCGAPVPEAAPPGALKAQPPPAEPPPASVPPPSDPAPVAPPSPVEPAAHVEPAATPAPAALNSPSTPPADENAPDFMDRLKGVFKKG